MKVAFIATGAANMYCGSCMRDNTLASAMLGQGVDITLLPLYTPMRLDEENVSEKHIFFGGIEAYLLQRYPKPSFLRDMLLRLAGSQALLRLMPRFDIGGAVDPAQNAELTLSMLRGGDGHQQSLLKELIDWLEDGLKPDLVHITNTLISGVAPEIKRRLGVPITCGLHGEDIFLLGLPASTQAQAIDLIHTNAAAIDHFIGISQYYIDFFAPWAGLDTRKITLVRPGITLYDYAQNNDTLPPAEKSEGAPLTIGYFARISPEKGLHILAQAFVQLCASGEFPNLLLKAGGYLSRAHQGYVDGIRQVLRKGGVLERAEILGTLERPEKLAFFRSLDVFSVPTIYRDPKGLPVLEALASGVPVVQPAHGAFPELVQATGGGLLHIPEDPVDLAEKLAQLLRNAPLRRSLAENGRQAVYNHFSASRMADETIQVFHRLLDAA